MVKLVKLLRSEEGKRVIDFGSGWAESLILRAEEFGITGLGLDISEDFCKHARKKLPKKGLSDRNEIVDSLDTVFLIGR